LAVRVEVRVFAHFSDYLPPENRKERGCLLEMPEDSRISDIIHRLGIPENEVNLLMRNDQQVLKDEILADGDVVGIFPPIAGGALSPLGWV
jgi:molybdopterin converting factor small subunit